MTTTHPSVSAVITTCGRPELLREAVRSILDQEYPGHVEVLVVFDKIEVDELADVSVPENRSLRTMKNARTSGLAGGRNTGIQAATGEVIAFCDDDDAWLPGKISSQVQLWNQEPSASAVSGGIVIRTGGHDVERLAPPRATFEDFLRSRITAIHPSTMLYRRADLDGGPIGLVDEELPGAFGEDYDLLLRASRVGDTICVQHPVIRVLWDRDSFFSHDWQRIADGLTYMLRKFPAFETDPKGLARIAGQVAFAHAALGHRAEARAWSRATLDRSLLQPRAWAALTISAGLVSPATLLGLVQKTGRGL